jgi:prepilin-type N-terminal cleavage/methylation domain-containing protein
MKKADCKFNKSIKSSKGFSLIELLIVVTIIGILAAISVINIFAAKRSANTSSAAAMMRLIHGTQASYSAGVGNGNFATPQGLFSEEYIDGALAAATNPTPTMPSKGGNPAPTQRPKNGYSFNFSNPGPTQYNIVARPTIQAGVGTTGDKAFYIDESGVLRATTTPTDVPDSNSAPLN